MPTMPPGLPVRRVEGRFLFVSQDKADADTNPDYTVITGTVKFTASVKKLGVVSQNLVIVPIGFEATFDSEGYLVPVGDTSLTRGIELPVTNSTVYDTQGFTWKVDFNLRDALTGNAIKLDSFSMAVPTATTALKLAEAMPVAESKGVIITRGEQGNGILTVTKGVASGTLLFTMDDFTTNTVDINDAVMGAFVAADKPSGIGIDTDGVPYISPLMNDAYIMYDTDGTPYFV